MQTEAEESKRRARAGGQLNLGVGEGRCRRTQPSERVHAICSTCRYGCSVVSSTFGPSLVRALQVVAESGRASLFPLPRSMAATYKIYFSGRLVSIALL